MPVDSVVGLIGAAGETVAAGEASRPRAHRRGGTRRARQPAPRAARRGSAAVAVSARQRRGRARHGGSTLDDLRRRKSSPVVRRIAHDHNIDIESLSGSGIGGRVTKRDILGYIDRVETPAIARPAARRARAFRPISPASTSR